MAAVLLEAAERWRMLKSLIIISPMAFFINVLFLAVFFVSADRGSGNTIKIRRRSYNDALEGPTFFVNGGSGIIRTAYTFLWQSDHTTGYHHVWPEIEFGWRIVVGTIVGFFGAAFGSVGGVGGGGVFVPMLSLIIGFDPKSATALSKCMITGGAASTVYYNLKLRHPTLDMPIIDYDLALLIQPMLMLGISIGVTFNVIFADWMVTSLLIVLFIVISTNAFFKGVETWKKETKLKSVRQLFKYSDLPVKETATTLEEEHNIGDNKNIESDPVPSSPEKKPEVTLFENIYWMELGLIASVWVAVLALQIAKNHAATCSIVYWVFNLLQIPVAVSVSVYQAIGLYKGRRVISSRGDEGARLRVHQLLLYCACGLVAGVVGGLLGLGGGFIMVPLFLEIGVPPQVASATASFAMAFSSSMSVVEYYLLKRFPVPYAMYLVAVATVAALVGQHIVRKIINLIGRASIIIFVLALMIFISAISLGGVGISHMIKRVEGHKYMGFENLCNYG